MSENSKPKAYKDGVCDFYGREFKVDERVLIPRPETEQLVDIVLELAGKAYLPGVTPTKRVLKRRPIIWDIGTGSGCIAVTLALELTGAEVVATDISPEALEVARKNARRLGATSVKFLQSDLLNEARLETPLTGADVIVANLPYVDENWEWLDREVLDYEPAGALFAPDGGLALIKKLIDQISEKCAERPLAAPRIVLEADPEQHGAIIAYATQRGWKCAIQRGYALLFSFDKPRG